MRVHAFDYFSIPFRRAYLTRRRRRTSVTRKRKRNARQREETAVGCTRLSATSNRTGQERDNFTRPSSRLPDRVAVDHLNLTVAARPQRSTLQVRGILFLRRVSQRFAYTFKCTATHAQFSYSRLTIMLPTCNRRCSDFRERIRRVSSRVLCKNMRID